MGILDELYVIKQQQEEEQLIEMFDYFASEDTIECISDRDYYPLPEDLEALQDEIG